MKNKIEDLRNHLFATLEALSPDAEKPMELDRAKAIADVARVIVDSAKAEVAYIAATGRNAVTGFIAIPEPVTPEQRRLMAVSGGRHA